MKSRDNNRSIARAAARDDARMSTGRVLGITAGVMLVGLIGGAAVAAPDQLLPLARLGAETVVTQTGPLLESGVHEAESAVAQVIAFIDRSSPRAVGMVAAGALTVLLSIAAGFTWLRSRRAATGSARPAPLSSALQVSNRRSAGARPTPKQVHALAAQGSTLAEIARGTGLPVDAVALLLAVGGGAGLAVAVDG